MPFEILAMYQDKMIDSQRGVKDVYRISFLVDGNGPFNVTTPVDGFTDQKAREIVGTEARKIENTLKLKG